MEVETQYFGDLAGEVCTTVTPDGATLAVTRLVGARESERPPLILLHGNYANRHFWISPKGIGLGAFLFQEGWDVWVAELRGHGLSPKDHHFPLITAEKHFRYDVPAINELVTERTGSRPIWVGHSFGGTCVVASMAAKWLPQEMIAGVVMFGSQMTTGERFLKFPPAAWLITALVKLLGHLPARQLGLGPEPEAPGVIMDFIRWKGLGGRWASSDAFCYWDGFPDVHVPVCAFAGAADRNDTPEGCRQFIEPLGSQDKKFVLLGTDGGFSRDYGHVEMVVSREAREEVWPMVAAWLRDHVTGL